MTDKLIMLQQKEMIVNLRYKLDQIETTLYKNGYKEPKEQFKNAYHALLKIEYMIRKTLENEENFNRVVEESKELKIHRIEARCIAQVCMHRCRISYLACSSRPDIGSSVPCFHYCPLYKEECAWRVTDYEEIPELTAILGRRKGE